MSRTRLSLLTLIALVVSVAVVGGCSESNPTAPGEGTPTDNRLLMFGFQDQEIPFFFITDPKPLDPSTDPPPFVSGVGLVSFGDTNSSVLEIVDLTQSNSFRPYSRQPGGEFQRANDFDIMPFDKQIHLSVDIAGVAHPAGVKNSSEYLVSGLLNGTLTPQSPYSNTVVPWGPTDYTLSLNINAIQVDSVLTINFIPDSRAVIYVVEMSLFDAINRPDFLLQGSLPLPIAHPHSLSFWFFVPPGQESNIRVPLYAVPFQINWFPLAVVVRVTAIDAFGRVVSRSPSDFVLDSQGSDQTNDYLIAFPSGGFFMVANPYPNGYRITTGGAEAAAVATDALPSKGQVIRHEEMARMVAGRPMTAVSERRVLSRIQAQVPPSWPSVALPVPPGLARKLPQGILPPGK
jgi:hypothetical protein